MAGNEKTVSVPVHVETADRVLPAVARGHEVTRLHFDQLAALGQPGERFFDGGPRLSAGAQFAHQLLKRCARMGKLYDSLEQSGVGQRHNYKATVPASFAAPPSGARLRAAFAGLCFLHVTG